MQAAAWFRSHASDFEEPVEAVKVPAAKPQRIKAPSRKAAKKKGKKR